MIEYNRCYKNNKKNYYRSVLDNADHDSKLNWKIIKDITNRSKLNFLFNPYKVPWMNNYITRTNQKKYQITFIMI